jgi:hypothetical protein
MYQRPPAVAPGVDDFDDERGESSMEATVTAGLRYEVKGDDVAINCAMRGDGRPERLAYRAAGEEREFAGDDLDVLATAIGTQVTVMLEDGAADGPIVRFTVVLPVVRPYDGEQFPVTSAAVRTIERSLFGGTRPGAQQAYEAMVLEGTVTSGPATEPPAGYHDFSAVHHHEPGGRATLVVSGICTVPGANSVVELRRAEPQGINPTDLLLERVVTERPVGPRLVVGKLPLGVDVPVRYEEPTDVEYRTVTILPGGPTIKVMHAR